MASLETFIPKLGQSTPEVIFPKECRYAYHVITPESVKDKDIPLRVLIWGHGSIMKPDYQGIVQETTVDALELAPYCERHNIVAIIPVLPRKESTLTDPPLDAQALSRPTLLRRIDPFYDRPDIDILLAAKFVLTNLKQSGHTVTDKFIVGGISAGATMANRLALLYPDLFSAVVLLKAGAFSLPSSEEKGISLPYPYGTSDIKEIDGNTHTKEGYCKLPFFVYFGEKDNNYPRDELQVGGSISENQVLQFGKTSPERMSYFADYMRLRGSTVEIEIGAGLGHQLEQNTISNAFKFMDGHTRKN